MSRFPSLNRLPMSLFLLSLTVTSLIKTVSSTIVSHEGHLIDRFCWERPNHAALDTNLDLSKYPETHTLKCLELSICKSSGFVVMESEPINGSYNIAYILDEAGNANAIKALESSNKTAGDSDFRVFVTGDSSETYSGSEPMYQGLQLLINATVTEVVPQIVEHTGYLIDRLCWLNVIDGVPHASIDKGKDLSLEPASHSVECLRLPGCSASGFVVLEEIPVNGMYQIAYILDDVGNENARNLIMNTNKDIKDGNFLVTIKGEVGSFYAGNETEFQGIPIITGATVEEVEPQIVEHTGYLIDRLCWLNVIDGVPHASIDKGKDLSLEPASHSVKCLRLPGCNASGFVVLESEPTDGVYEIAYILDETGNNNARAAILNTNKDATEGDFLVTIRGEIGPLYGGEEPEFQNIRIMIEATVVETPPQNFLGGGGDNNQPKANSALLTILVIVTLGTLIYALFEARNTFCINSLPK